MYEVKIPRLYEEVDKKIDVINTTAAAVKNMKENTRNRSLIFTITAA